MRIITIWLPVALGLILTWDSAAWAGEVYLETSVRPQYFKTNQDSYDRTAFAGIRPESGLGFDTRNGLGYIFWNKLMIGGAVNYSRLPYKREAAELDDGVNPPIPFDSADDDTKRLEYGASLGVFLGNFRIIGSWLFGGYSLKRSLAQLPDGTTSIDGEIKDRIGSGYQILVGYNFQLAGNLKIGPTLGYRYVNYKSQDRKNNLAPTDPNTNYEKRAYATKPVESTLEPMLTLSLSF